MWKKKTTGQAQARVSKATGPLARPCQVEVLRRGLAVTAALSAATGTAATSAPTTTATLLSTRSGTIPALRCAGSCRCGHCLFTVLRFLGIRLVVDLETFNLVFVVIVEVGSAFEGNGVLGGGSLTLRACTAC